MKIFSDIQNLRKYITQIKLQEKSIGFVPTMGALHKGHLSLINNSIEQNNVTICSIFVNPTQFNNPKDLKGYPRKFDDDISLLKETRCNAVFIPPADVMYEKDYILSFDFGYFENIMEGNHRPDHFKGVGLIVTKFFNLILPNTAYFGTKDLQQLVLIKKLTKELFFDLKIVAVPTIRESDGLAMSSRNSLLTKKERDSAIYLYKSLNEAKNKLLEGESLDKVYDFIKHYFDSLGTIKLEYFEIVNTSDLKKTTDIIDASNVSLCIAGHLGKVRLIDNISLN